MKLAADDPVRVVRTIFREIDDQAIDKVSNQGNRQDGSWAKLFRSLGALNCCLVVFCGQKKPARGGLMKGDWGYSKG